MNWQPFMNKVYYIKPVYQKIIVLLLEMNLLAK